VPSAAPATPRVAEVTQQFHSAVRAGRLDLPLPGRGATLQRWRALLELAADDLCVARLAEAHLDALAILDELDGPPVPTGSSWGVWAAHPPSPSLTARQDGGGWRLDGTKPWCSGARACTHALVTADAPDGYRLFAVDLTGARPVPGTWHAVGMAGSDSLDVEFTDVPATAVGGPGAYLDRPGFWHGAMAVAAVWHGGAIGVARALLDAPGRRVLGPHALAHLGAVDAALSGVSVALEAAAAQVDADPEDKTGDARLTGLRLRAQTERTAADVLDRVGRALGAGPLCRDARHAALTADLPVYLRQSHAEADLAGLGALVLERGAQW
jgi:alkylation response protein AidB-like acyl-CoA dehydrogenase